MKGNNHTGFDETTEEWSDKSSEWCLSDELIDGRGGHQDWIELGRDDASRVVIDVVGMMFEEMGSQLVALRGIQSGERDVVKGLYEWLCGKAADGVYGDLDEREEVTRQFLRVVMYVNEEIGRKVLYFLNCNCWMSNAETGKYLEIMNTGWGKQQYLEGVNEVLEEACFQRM